MMKILQIIQKPQLRGAEIFACQLSMHLTSKGHQVDIAYLFEHSTFDLDFPLKFISLQGKRSRRFFDIKAYKKIAELVKNNGYDIIQANAGDTLKYTAISKILYKWKTPLIFRNANKISDFINSATKLYINRLFVSQANYVISVSELCKQDFQNTFNYPESKIAKGTIGTEMIEVEPINDALAHQWKGKRILLNVGGLVPEKNQQVLIKMLPEWLEQFPDVILVLIGVGKEEGKLKLLSRELGVKNNIQFLGSRKDVLSILKYSKALLLPSLIEGLPGVILEAQWAGIPVISYNVGGISEVINEKTGWIIEPNSAKLFSNTVIDILSMKPEDRQIVVKAAKQQIEQVYNNQLIAGIFERKYLQICNF